MNRSEIARRFERRSGFELVDYSDVALPMYRLTVDVVTMVHRKIPPIKEFVLRTVATGFDNASDIAAFLGLDPQTTEATIGVARDERYVAAAGGDDDRVMLLDRGRDVLAKECESAPQDEMLVILFDGNLRKPVWLGSEPLHAPSEINPRMTIEIRPYPATLPETSDLSIVDVSQVLHKQYGGRADFGKDILAIKRIARRQRLFRTGVALVYRKMRASDIQIAFIVDDARNELLEHTFAERGGPRKMGFVKALDELNDMQALRRHLGTDITRLLPDATDLDQRRLKVSTARLRVAAAMRKDSSPTGSVEDAPAKALEAVAQAEEELRGFAARPAFVYELPTLFDGALGTATQRIIISTRQVDDEILTSERLKALGSSLRRGVSVTIRIAETAPVPRGRKFSALAELGKLGRQYVNLQVAPAQLGKLYHLIKDSDFALVCNRPILGSGSKVRVFSHFSGFLLQTAQLVDAYAQRHT